MERLQSSTDRERPHYAPMVGAWRRLFDAEVSRTEPPSDASIWRSAAEAFTAIPYLRAYCLLRLGEASIVRGRAGAATGAAVGEAREIADQLGAEPLRREL